MKQIKEKIFKLSQKNYKQKGFTLIEMVVVIAIVVMLMVLIAPNLMKQKTSAENKSNRAFATTLQTQVVLYNDEHSKDLTSLEQLKNKNYLSQDQIERLNKNQSLFSLKDGEVIYHEKK